MEFLLLTKSSAFLIGPIASVLGYIMDFIYEIFSLIGIENIGLCIILFTIITNVLMLPLTIKQQRFTKLNAVMNPELQAIQKKYKGRQQDQVAMQKQQAETQAVYEKYGASPTAGCLPMLIQLPVMFALYRVIYNIPAYIRDIKTIYCQVANPLKELFTSPEVIESYTEFVELAKSNNFPITNNDYTQVNKIVDLLYQFDASEWKKLGEIFPDLSGVIESTAAEVINLNNFLGGINLMEAPGFKISIALIIPIMAGLTQWISAKIMERDNPNRDADPENENTMAKSMKSMNTIMPLMSVFICISLPACIGIYWIASSVVRTVLQICVNQSMKKISIEDLIRSNIEKQNKKREKKGLAPISADASIRTTQRAQEIMEQQAAAERLRQEKIKELKAQGKLPETDLEKKNPGSIAAKARMVQEYNERTGGKK